MDFADTSCAGTSVDVERAFSRGRRALTHTRSRLSAQTTRALLCLGDWCRRDIVGISDIVAVASTPDDVQEDELEDGWDRIEKPGGSST